MLSLSGIRNALARSPPADAPSSHVRRSVYTINVLITLAAAGDQRGAILHGVQTLAKLSLYPMQVLYDPATDAMSSSYGNGTPKSFHPADKKDLLIVISVMDVVAMLCLLAGIAAFRRAAAKSSAEVEAATLTLDDYSAVVYGLPREALDGAEVTAHLEAAVPALKDTVAQVFVGKNFGEFLERLTARGNALEALDSLDAQAAATKKDLSKPRAKLSAKLAKLEGEMANLHEGKLVAVCAYVTFKTHAARDAALDAFPCGALRAALPGLLPRERRFRGTHSLRLRAARELRVQLVPEGPLHRVRHRHQRRLLCTHPRPVPLREAAHARRTGHLHRRQDLHGRLLQRICAHCVRFCATCHPCSVADVRTAPPTPRLSRCSCTPPSATSQPSRWCSRATTMTSRPPGFPPSAARSSSPLSRRRCSRQWCPPSWARSAAS